MRTRIRRRLDHYTVHCPTCGAEVKHGSEVKRAAATMRSVRPAPASTGIVTGWESWATDLEIDSFFEDHR